jgi:hypothetical protein
LRRWVFANTPSGQSTAGWRLSGRQHSRGTERSLSLTTGTFNTAIGLFSLLSLTDGSFNTATGAGTLLLNTGAENTATGAGALLSNTTGSENTADGAFALFSNTTGIGNTASGRFALFSNTTGSGNTANGHQALLGNTTGASNSADGNNALVSNTEGNSNTATGDSALHNNITGSFNTANGANALPANTTGDDNTAMGSKALTSNSTGNNNTAVGFDSLFHNTTGSSNIALGVSAGHDLTTGNNNIDIGNTGVAAESNTIRIGDSQTKTFIAGIRDVTTGNADTLPVLIDSAGQLGTTSSSRRFKKEIKSMDKASEAILALRPVTFHYKSDKTNRPQFGLIAEEVADVNPDLVACDQAGVFYTVRYEAVSAMLLNEFLKNHRKVREQQREIDSLKAELKEQRNLIQKVSDRLEMREPAELLTKNP